MVLETHILLKARTGIAAVTFAALAVLLPTREAAAASVIFSATGVDAAGIITTVDAFRTALGNINPNVAGSFGTGRREINWDGVPDAFAAPNALPANFFNANSPRGVVFETPGSGFQVSASNASGQSQFANINPTYPSNFEPFSPQRLFTALNSNIVDVNFFVPGSVDAALTRGFGAVFRDVDLANTTSLTFFGNNNEFLGTFFVPEIAGDQTFSFLGVLFESPQVSRVRITSGNVSLGAGQFDPDVVVMDDFIFGEPSNTPLPAALPLFATGLGALGLLGWRRKRKQAA